MDSRTLLDRALFQLTPTRTRFELMLFAKGKKEKFASGLFDPFVSHLKVARDEISKGGYSISLQPSSRDAPWFTKGTFERFVRFVSTPAVLERFVSLEAEINQIESSIQQDSSGISLVGNSDVRKSSESSKLKGEHEGKVDTPVEENSKIRLQRLLESRKTLLRKEQAMAYARGLVAGFDNENVDDLVSFADAFGASRLREACTDFKELCKKKHADVLWMEELAAVETWSPSELSMGASGIILANDSSISMMEASKSHATANSDSSKANGSPASDQTQSASAKHQVPLHWQNHLPQYMYNFQGPIQQFPFYQGYPLPLGQPGSLNYPSNVHRYYNRNQKPSSRKKEKLKTGEADSGESTETESSISDSETNSDSQAHQLGEGNEYRKKHRKKSSRTVVIRNINYITPNKRNKEKGQAFTESSDEDELVDKGSLKWDIDGAVGLLESSDNLHDDRDSTTSRQGRATDAWGAFQGLLMKNENSSGVKTLEEPMDVVKPSHGEFTNVPGTVDLESEKYYAKQKVLSDSFIATQRIGENETGEVAINFINGENGNSILKRRDSGADDFLILNRIEEQGVDPNDIISTIGEKSTMIRSTEDEEWLIVGQSVEPGNRNAMTEQNIFGGDHILPVDNSDTYMKGNHRERLIDDSFMVASRPEADDQYNSPWKTEISIAGEIIMASKAENGTTDVKSKQKEPGTRESDDLCMIFERDSDFDSIKNSWTMEHGLDLSLTEATTTCSGTEADKSANLKLSSDNELKGNGDSKVKVPDKVTKSKVSPGSLRKSRAEIVLKSKKPPFVNRTIVHKSKFEQEEEMRKRMEELAIQRQKRIAERTAASSANASPASRKMASEGKTSKNSMTNRNLANRANPVKLGVA